MVKVAHGMGSKNDGGEANGEIFWYDCGGEVA